MISPVFQDLRNPDKYKGKCGVCEFTSMWRITLKRAYAMMGDYLESEPFCIYIPKGSSSETTKTKFRK